MHWNEWKSFDWSVVALLGVLLASPLLYDLLTRVLKLG